MLGGDDLAVGAEVNAGQRLAVDGFDGGDGGDGLAGEAAGLDAIVPLVADLQGIVIRPFAFGFLRVNKHGREDKEDANEEPRPQSPVHGYRLSVWLVSRTRKRRICFIRRLRVRLTTHFFLSNFSSSRTTERPAISNDCLTMP